MRHKNWLVIILFLFIVLRQNVHAQSNTTISVNILKTKTFSPPAKVVNIPFFIKNNSSNTLVVIPVINMPKNWELVTQLKQSNLKPKQQIFQILSVKVPAGSQVGDYKIEILINDYGQNTTLAKGEVLVNVQEVEKITLQIIEAKESIMAGEEYRAGFIVSNEGNTEKNVFIETQKCDVDGDVNIKLSPGESKSFEVAEQISKEITNTRRDYISVAVLEGGVVKDRIFKTLMIFPVKSSARDLYFRYPIKASVSYMGASQNGIYESARQYELSGNGSLDPEGKHHLEFVARGPNNSDLSYLGSYDQYYVNYANNTFDVTLGEKAYQFTPLTESSRYGAGIENRISLKNGLSTGFLYVKPRFYKEIDYEMAFYAGYDKPGETKIEGYFIQKKKNTEEDLTYLMSLNTLFKPFKKTTLGMEISRGFNGDVSGNAFRTNFNTQFSIFSVQGEYYRIGENYPGYYNNSKFYSGSVSAQVTKKLNMGIYARQDFTNAELDTFFVTAPYTRSLQYYLNYNIASNTSIRIYWNESERKDRLAEGKFHYNSRLLNTQFQQKINRFNYTLTGSYGKTANYLLSELSSEQNTYRFSTTLGFRFSTKFSVRTFLNYSNLNSYISGEQQNVVAGLAVNSQIRKKVNASLYLQNAYDIDDYYRNRNLLQFNLNYKVSKNHTFAFQSYYTLFRNQTEDPELYLAANYTYTFGAPLKQVIKAGDLEGRLIDPSGEPKAGIQLQLLGKTTITDKNGQFGFYSVAPGVHLLGIDRTKFELDEMPDMPSPITVEILEDQKTELNIVITRGAKVTGRIRLTGSMENPKLENIVVELRNEFKYYRVLTDGSGAFSFPLVLPQHWTLKVYENSLPNNQVLSQNIFEFDLEPGENKFYEIEMKEKKRRIIFKSQNFSLSNSGTSGLSSLKTKETAKPVSNSKKEEQFYTVQVGAFTEKLSADSQFFNNRGFDFEKQIDNLYKYYLGRFKKLSDAQRFRNELKKEFRSAFVVQIKNGKVLQVKTH